MMTLLLMFTAAFAQEDKGYKCTAACLAQSCDFQEILEPISYSTNLSRDDVFARARILCQRQAQKSAFHTGYLIKSTNSDDNKPGFWPIPANPKEDCIKDQSIPADQTPDYFGDLDVHG